MDKIRINIEKKWIGGRQLDNYFKRLVDEIKPGDVIRSTILEEYDFGDPNEAVMNMQHDLATEGSEAHKVLVQAIFHGLQAAVKASIREHDRS